MRRIQLQGKHWVTFGSKGGGKSYFNSKMLERASGKSVIFDPMDEYPDADNIIRVVPDNTRGEGGVKELQKAIEFIKYNSDDIAYFIVDEISRFHKKRGILDDTLGELVDLNRHMDIGIGFIARRPTQVHTDLREMADYLFLFTLRGTNDLKMLDNISSGLQQKMNTMNEAHEDHSFITVYPSRKYEIMDPVEW